MTELAWPAGVPVPLSSPPLTNARSEGPAVINWIQANCIYGDGDSYGKPVRLDLFQKLFLCQLFELRSDGRRRYRRALLEVPKGNSKSSLAAWVAAYQLAHQFSPIIPIVASSYDQAELVFGDLRTAVSESPTLSQVFVPFEGEIQVANGPGRAFKIPAVAGTSDGLRPSTAIFDELHEFIGHNRERVHLIVSNGCTKRRDSLILNVTTPGFDKDTLAGRLHTYGLRVNAGEVDDAEFLFVQWGCPADRYDLSTPDGLRACIRDANPAADKFLSVEDIAARYHQIPQNEWLRYHAGIWTTSAQSWLPDGAWNACAAPGLVIPDGADMVLGFDGSHSNDSTAVVAVTCTPVPHIGLVDVWERDDTDQDWKVPIEDVEQCIRDACRRYRVREVVCDPFRWQRSMQILADEGLPIVEFPQNASRMTPATQRFYEAILNKAVSHDGSPVLARHINNAVLKADHRGQRLVKETAYSHRKIDAAVAACMALDRASAPAPDDYDIMASVL
jgi:phage terminase large subunit-like protein